MNIMHKLMVVVAMAAAVVCTGFGDTVTNVRGLQRPNSNLVDIYYDLNATDGGTYTVEVAIEGRTDTVTATTFSGDLGTGIAPGKNRHIVWEAGADWRGKKGDVKAVVTATVEERKEKPKKVQLWAGGPYWADRNVGASSPEDYGLYFRWGDTTGHRPSGTTFSFDLSNFSASNTTTHNKTPATLQSEGWVVSQNGTYVLAPAHDAAHVHWGGSWRMPTYQELNDLCNNMCDWIWTTQNGVNGFIVRGRGAYASNSIFLPAAGIGYETSLIGAGSYGFYWSSVPASVSLLDSWGLGFYLWSSHYTDDDRRLYGYSVRPVQGSTK